MKSLNAQQIAEKRRECNPWRPKEERESRGKVETVEEFLMRGGKIEKCKPLRLSSIDRHRQCCMNTFENIT